MIDKQQLRQLRLMNHLPLNRIAASFLPGGRALATEMAVLTLMRWGLTEGGITVTPRGPGDPDQDQVETQLDLMTRWNPVNVLAFLLNPERLPGGEEALTAADLAAADSAEDAATRLLEQLHNAMAATLP